MAEAQRDWMTRDNAIVQARQIREFWWSKGYHLIDVRTKTLSSRFGEITVIESNMIDGMPPR